jgi:anti-sigma regulatory factor (Ser/Thr protein kinase)
VIDLVRDDVLLVASELVSNAVLHAGCDPTDEIEVVAELRASRFRLTVIDPGTSGSMPTVRGSDYRGPGGKGLQVVETLSRRWGSDRRDGTVVWAELSLEAGGSELAPI